jgi:RNA polymerase sigma factor (sigma-70 family)
MKDGHISDISPDILRGCQARDRRSQELLYREFFGFAMAICMRYCKTNDEAKEVLNDGFLKVFNKIESFDASLSFKAWFKRILINTSIDHYRAQSKHYNHYDLDTAIGAYKEEETPLDKISYEELFKKIQLLPPAYKMAFNLYVIDGFTHEQISKQLGISVGTSKSNVTRAREFMRKILSTTNQIYFEK